MYGRFELWPQIIIILKIKVSPRQPLRTPIFKPWKKVQNLRKTTPPYQNCHQFIADRSWKFSVEKEGHPAEQPLPDVSHL